MRGEKPATQNKIVVAATIIDENGVPKYHIVPSKLTTFGIASLGLFLVLAAILGYLIWSNKSDIEHLRRQITVDEQQGDSKK